MNLNAAPPPLTTTVHVSFLIESPDEHASKKTKHHFAFVFQCLLGDGAARGVFSVVRGSRMWCPHDIGRDSWEWGEQETLYNIISPHEVGEEAVTDVSSLSGKSGVARG